MAWQEGHRLVLEDTDEVANAVGSSEWASPSGSWKKYWLQHSGRAWPSKCQLHNCGEQAAVGAHIRVKRFKQYFILPACYSCNNSFDRDYGSDWSSAKKNALVVWAGAV